MKTLKLKHIELPDLPDLKYPEIRFRMIKLFDEYMKSDDWKRVKIEVKKRAGGTCADCGEFIGEKGTCHHKYYDDWGKGNTQEALSCVYLCRKCNTKRHNKPEMRKLVPFWAKRNQRWDCLDDIDFTERRKLNKELQQDYEIEKSRSNKMYGLLLDLTLLNCRIHKEKELQRLIRKSKKVIQKILKEELDKANL